MCHMYVILQQHRIHISRNNTYVRKYKLASRANDWALVLPFSPKYRLVHPENYLFLLSKKMFSGSNYPTNYFI